MYAMKNGPLSLLASARKTVSIGSNDSKVELDGGGSFVQIPLHDHLCFFLSSRSLLLFQRDSRVKKNVPSLRGEMSLHFPSDVTR